MTTQTQPPNGRYVLRQGLLLSAGSVLAQFLGLLRNVIFARLALPVDFGIAILFAVVALTIEMIAGLAIDKFIVQNRDGDRPELQQTIHLLTALRGFVFALLLFILAPFIAETLNVPDAVGSFRWLAILPIMSGLIHSDIYRFQRNSRQVPYMISVEMLPQLISVGLIYPLFLFFENYNAMLVALIISHFSKLCFTHLFAQRPYHWLFSIDHMVTLLRFSWPIMLTALPLYAIFQGDKILVASLVSTEALAVYSAAFTLSMIAANTGTRIMTLMYLPILARLRDDHSVFSENYRLCNQLSTLLATLFSFGFIVFGGVAVALAFGPNYEGYFQLAALCGIMWGVRMLSIAPTVALLAIGNSRATLLPSVLRACVLIPTYFVLEHTQNLNSIVILGALGEGIALLTIYFSAAKAGYGNNHIPRAWAFFCCSVVATMLLFFRSYGVTSTALLLVVTLIGCIAISLMYFVLFPDLIKQLRAQLFESTAN